MGAILLTTLLIAGAGPQSARLASAEARLEQLERQGRAQEEKIAATEAPLARLLAAIQRLALRPPVLALAAPGSIDDLIHTRALLAALAPAVADRVAGIRRDMAATEALRAETAQMLAAMVEGDPARLAAQDAKTSDALAALPGPLPRPGTAPAASLPPVAPVYRLPAPGTVVIGMGERSGKGAARGLTLATPSGAAVVAPASGQIAYAGRFRGYGDIVIIDHGHGWKTVLAGLASINADVGGRAIAGQRIGRMGQAQPRLTVELRHDGRAVDVAGMAAYR